LLSTGAFADGSSTKARVHLQFGAVQEIRSLLQTLVPGVKYSIEGDDLMLEGSPADISTLKNMLREVDRPTDLVMVDSKLVSMTKQCLNELREILVESPTTKFRDGSRTMKGRNSHPGPAATRSCPQAHDAALVRKRYEVRSILR